LLVAAAVMGFGLAPVLSAAGKAGELLVKVASGAWDGVVWLFSNIFAPGLKNIASNGSSILTMLALAVGLYVVVDHNNTRQEVALAKSRDYFANEMRGFKATLNKTRQELATCKSLVGRAVKK
jgi:hypothetical protein